MSAAASRNHNTAEADFPQKSLYYYRDQAGLWKYADQLLTRFDAPLSLLIRSANPAIRLFIRKLLLQLFNWKHTLLIDLGDRPDPLSDTESISSQNDRHYAETQPEKLVQDICKKTKEHPGNTPVVILCDTIPTACEGALIEQLLIRLTARSPLFLCLEPSDHFSFTWTLSEDIPEQLPTSPPAQEHWHTAQPILKKIGRILAVIPDRLSLDQIKKWFEPSERRHIQTCLDHGYLMEKSGRIIISDLLDTESLSIATLDEQHLLRQALRLHKTALTELKCLLMDGDLNALRSVSSSPPFLRQLHQQPRGLITVLKHTEPHWSNNPDMVILLAELTMTLYLLPATRSLLDKISSSAGENKVSRKLEAIFHETLNYSCEELMALVMDRPETVSTCKHLNSSGLLKDMGYLSLAVMAETQALLESKESRKAEHPVGKMNELLFRSKCLDNPDLTIWVSLAFAHWHMRHGSPASSHTLLRDCLPRSSEGLLSVQPSLNLSEILLGHWKKPSHSWPPMLPGHILPPDILSWDYLQQLLLHRFAEAGVKYKELTNLQREMHPKESRLSAGLCLQNMAILNKCLNSPQAADSEQIQTLPPWLKFILSALEPFCSPSGKTGRLPPVLPSSLLGKERNYFYYEFHYLRFHTGSAAQIIIGEDRDVFLDTCAYFSRRGRHLSPQILEIRSTLADAALAESRASDSILIKRAQGWHTAADHLKAALDMILTRLSPNICFIRLFHKNCSLHSEGFPHNHEALADYLFSLAGTHPEEDLNINKVRTTSPESLTPLLLPLHSIRLLQLHSSDKQITLSILLGYKSDPHPHASLYDRIQRHLSPFVDLLQTRLNSFPSGDIKPLDSIIGDSAVIIELKKQIQRISQVDFTVTITGESGTGKELIARAIHQLSTRREQVFMPFNCASLPETLLEAELFGYQKGAFTDARENRTGLIEASDGGTLFLDEIGEMPLLLQAKLLRFLSDHSIRRIGENQNRRVNCRILCATHCDLRSMVNSRLFREDLFYRIHELTLICPPLRDRKEDLPLLINHFTAKYSFHKLNQTQLHWLALKWMSLDWPGNVRELESRIKELITYYPHHPDIEGSSHLQPFTSGTLQSARNLFERICILDALEKNDWNRIRSAASLGISRIALFKLMRKHKLKETTF